MFYKLDRFSPLHNATRKSVYFVLNRVPDSIKYTAGYGWRRLRLPYKLLRSGDTAIQVGAPWDILRAGRSRAVYFAKFVGRDGRVLAIEPSTENVEALRAFASRHRLSQLDVVPLGLWSSKTTLQFLISDDHPASNLVADVATTRHDLGDFKTTEVQADTLDNIVSTASLRAIRLLSLTTNGSERQILEGASQTLSKVEYVSIITREADEVLETHGFRLFAEDDRGFIFQKHVQA